MWLGVSNGEILGTFYDGSYGNLHGIYKTSMRHMMERMGKFAWENLHGWGGFVHLGILVQAEILTKNLK